MTLAQVRRKLSEIPPPELARGETCWSAKLSGPGPIHHVHKQEKREDGTYRTVCDRKVRSTRDLYPPRAITCKECSRILRGTAREAGTDLPDDQLATVLANARSRALEQLEVRQRLIAAFRPLRRTKNQGADALMVELTQAGYSLDEVGRMFGFTRETIRQRIDRARS